MEKRKGRRHQNVVYTGVLEDEMDDIDIAGIFDAL
mgnify:CR=1 FL=1